MIGKCLNEPTSLGVYSNWAGESKLESTKALPATSTNRMEMVGIPSLFLFSVLSSELV